MDNLSRLQAYIRDAGWAGLMIPSTDEYLSEFAQPFAQRLSWVTGFQGSTGVAVMTPVHAALFVDGRYTLQAQHDVKGSDIDVIGASEVLQWEWMGRNLSAERPLAVDSRLHSHPDLSRTMKRAAELSIQVLEIADNPIDKLWGAARPPAPNSQIFDYAPRFAGKTSREKIADLCKWMQEARVDLQLVADPEDVAWLLNVRTDDSRTVSPNGWHTVPIALSQAIVSSDGLVRWFVDQRRLQSDLVERISKTVTILDPGRFEQVLTECCAGKVVSANLRKTSYKYAEIAARVGKLRSDSVVTQARWIKHANEVQRAREGHFIDGQAVIRFLCWLQSAIQKASISELQAAEKLMALRSERDEYKGISMPLMSASGSNGAMPHYIPGRDSDVRLNDHPIYWMDSGGQYYGCSTDNTVCIALGIPEPKHIRAHTLVVKGFIALACVRFPAGIYSTQLDSFARQYLWNHGMDYGHGTGHGVGNFMNIHEGPYLKREVDHPLVAPIQAGMIISNEPGYYAAGDFGIRIESHLAVVPSQYPGFLEFETLSRLPIDPHLVDFSLLSADEKQWLAQYHQRVFDGYVGCFDEPTNCWLRGIVDAYLSECDVGCEPRQ